MKCWTCGSEMVRDISTARCPGCGYFADLLPVDKEKLAEWKTTAHLELLPDGNYRVHPVEAP